jgi:hypothetical protein
MDRRVSLVFALLVAVLLVSNPLYSLQDANEPEYDHSIDRIEQGEIPDEIDVLQYDSLSPNAQAVINQALVDPDGQETVAGEENKPPEFFYSDNTSPNRGQYVIEKNGTYYELSTSAGGGFLGVARLTQHLLQLLGVGVALTAIGMRDAPQVPVAAAGVATVPLLLVSVGLYDGIELLVLLAALGSFVVMGALAVVVDAEVSFGTAAVAVFALLVALVETGGGLFIVLAVTMTTLGLLVGGIVVVVGEWLNDYRNSRVTNR